MLAGRSYGKVYKGRWRGGTVAIKVLAHNGSVVRQMSALREALLCKNITHPNVVRFLGYSPAPLFSLQRMSIWLSRSLSLRESLLCNPHAHQHIVPVLTCSCLEASQAERYLAVRRALS